MDATSEETNKWATMFETTHPVLNDSKKVVWNQYRQGSGKPQYILFDRDMTVLYKGTGNSGHAQVQELILAMLDAE